MIAGGHRHLGGGVAKVRKEGRTTPDLVCTVPHNHPSAKSTPRRSRIRHAGDDVAGAFAQERRRAAGDHGVVMGDWLEPEPLG